jgi:ABC-type branched-subunit amino acid transport system permease subunit
MACWGLNLQFGVAGIMNFAYIVFQAAGAYTAAVLTLGPSSDSVFQHYIGGANLPFPIPIIAAGAVGAGLSFVVGTFTLRRLRVDYQAMVMLVVSLIALNVAINQVDLVNGSAGLSLVPKPLSHVLNLALVDYQWFYVGLTAVCCGIVFLLVHQVTRSPLGRTLRAIRDNEHSAEALGKNVARFRLLAFVLGGAIAGVSGAIFVEFIGAWSPGAWTYAETFVLFTAVIVGGTGNNLGVALGALLVPVVFLEATRFLPPIGYPGLMDALQWVAVGLLAMLFLWVWPRGVIPERRRRFRRPAPN